MCGSLWEWAGSAGEVWRNEWKCVGGGGELVGVSGECRKCIGKCMGECGGVDRSMVE